jgi:hypothetical protein
MVLFFHDNGIQEENVGKHAVHVGDTQYQRVQKLQL